MAISLKWNIDLELNFKKKSKKWTLTSRNASRRSPSSSALSTHMQQDIGVLDSVSDRRLYADYL